MEEKTVVLWLDADPAAYGDGATEETPAEYAAFAEKYLREKGYEEVEIRWYEGFPPRFLTEEEVAEELELQDEIWQAYIAS